MTKEAKFIEYDFTIYPFKLWIGVGGTLNCVKEWFVDNDGSELTFTDKEENNSLGITMDLMRRETSDYGVLVYFSSKERMTTKVIAHEATHAARRLFEHINADIDNEEPFAYAVGFIAECCDEVKRRKFKKEK